MKLFMLIGGTGIIGPLSDGMECVLEWVREWNSVCYWNGVLGTQREQLECIIRPIYSACFPLDF